MIENSSFISFGNEVSGLIYDDTEHEKYPISYYNVINGEGIDPKRNCSYYGFVYEGIVAIDQAGFMPIYLEEKMYFSVSGKFDVCGKGKVIVIEVEQDAGVYPETKYSATRVFGGKLEKQGRLKYIDGCTDSLLIPPVKLGNPCLNHLHFPPKIDQTAHTHPSHRIGIVSSGNGLCKTPFGNIELTEGMIFIIKEWDGKTTAKGLDGEIYPAGTHSFQTFDESMDVIAFHPDSDFGATDIDHPMINRTIVDGVSANQLDDIRTK